MFQIILLGNPVLAKQENKIKYASLELLVRLIYRQKEHILFPIPTQVPAPASVNQKYVYLEIPQAHPFDDLCGVRVQEAGVEGLLRSDGPEELVLIQADKRSQPHQPAGMRRPAG